MNFEQPETHVIPWKMEIERPGLFWQRQTQYHVFPYEIQKVFLKEDRHSGRCYLLRTTAFCGQTFWDEHELTHLKTCWFSSMIFERWLMAGATGAILNNL